MDSLLQSQLPNPRGLLVNSLQLTFVRCIRLCAIQDLTSKSAQFPGLNRFSQSLKYIPIPNFYCLTLYTSLIFSVDVPPAEPRIIGAHLGELCRPQQKLSEGILSQSWRGIRRTRPMTTHFTSRDRDDGEQTQCCAIPK